MTTSLRFERYRSQIPSRASVDQRDQEVIGEDEETLIAAVAITEEQPHQEGRNCVCMECLHNIRHITYDVCFCKNCLEEEVDLKYEPINAQKRSNKPRNKKKQKWSTLGEPSGKWDYYVRYDATHSTTSIEEVAATGWGDEFEDKADKAQTPITKFRVCEQNNTAGEYKRIHREAHTYPINVDTAHTLEKVAGTMETAAIKNAVTALTEVHEIMRYKAQICCGKRTRDNYFQDVWPEISAQTLKARRLLQEAQELLNLQQYPKTSLVSELVIKALWKAKSLNTQGYPETGQDQKGKGSKKIFTNEFGKTMSERFEKAIQDWYDRSRTANLEYLDLSGISKIKLSDLSHNSSVIYDRLLLFSKVSIKHFNNIKEQNEVLSEKIVDCENQKEFSKGLQQISSEVQGSKPLTKKEVLELVEEIAQQPKKVEEEALKLTAEANPDYIEAKQATEEIEIPSIGFAVPSEFKEGTIKTLGAVIKQNNTILYLLIKQGEEVRTIREELIEVKNRLTKFEKQEATPQEFGEAIADLTKRLEKQRKEMSQRRVPTLFSVREGTLTEDLPTQDDQVRDYQWTQRRRFELQRGFRRLRGQRYNNTLESMVNPEQQLAISGRRRAQLAPAEVLYSYHRQTARHRVYEHYSEQRINCGEGDQVDLRLCNNQSYQALQREGMQHIHIGLAMIRIHTLHRTGAGTNALVVLQDTRWTDTTRIISTMEVDLAQGTQLVYMVPDMMMSINDFHNHLRVSIQTHGYETWQGGESNLLITLSMIGRLSNTSYVGFNYNIENVVEHLSTTGISAIPGERRTMEELEGQSWHLRPIENEEARIPTGVAVNQRINRTTSLRFERYRSQIPSRASVDQRDQEVIGEDEETLIAAVAITEEQPHQEGRNCFEDKADKAQTPITKFRVCEQNNTDSSESEWENPFAAKHGGNQDNNENKSYESCFHLNEDDDELPYPKFVRQVERILASEAAYPTNDEASSSGIYNPPRDSMMGPPVYPPATGNYQQFNEAQFQPKSHKGFKGDYGNYHNQQWSLPPAYAGTGALLVLPEDPGL
ncbi:Orf y [Tanacetum coccineum]